MKMRYFITCICLLLLASCSKDLEVNKVPDFNVTTESTTYKVGEEVKFNITGTADNLSFYSGTPNNDYAYRNGRVIDLGNSGASMVFSSSVDGGTQANQLSVLASTNFNGDYSSIQSLQAATWVDITNRFVFGSTTTFLTSGEKDISDLLEPGSPIYIAFKY